MKYELNPDSRVPLTFQALDIRRKLNKDTIIVIVGEKRSGKSYGAIKIAEKIKGPENWDVRQNLFFDLKPFLYWMQATTDGVCIVDEASVNYNARVWFDLQVRIFNQILTTQGFRKNTIIMTLPTLHHLDKWAIDLCHFLFVTLRCPYLKCYRIKNSQFKRQMFPVAYEILKMDMPSKTNVERYEEMKRQYNNDKISNDLNYISMAENPETFATKLKPKELLKALSVGTLTPDEFMIKFKQIGYLERDANLMIRTVEKINEITDRKRKGKTTIPIPDPD